MLFVDYRRYFIVSSILDVIRMIFNSRSSAAVEIFVLGRCVVCNTDVANVICCRVDGTNNVPASTGKRR